MEGRREDTFSCGHVESMSPKCPKVSIHVATCTIPVDRSLLGGRDSAHLGDTWQCLEICLLSQVGRAGATGL